MAPPILSLEDVHLHHGDGWLFTGLDLHVGPKDRLALIGRNGAGKTTTLRSVMGFTDVRGQILVDGQDVTRMKPSRRPSLGIGYAPEDRRLFTGFTVEENILLPGEVAGLDANERAGRLDKVYQVLPELKEMADRPAGAVSGGQGKMVALGRALMLSTRLLMLDEPFQGLAPALAQRYAEALKRLRDIDRDVTVIVTESNPALLKSFAERTLVIERGAITEPDREAA